MELDFHKYLMWLLKIDSSSFESNSSLNFLIIHQVELELAYTQLHKITSLVDFYSLIKILFAFGNRQKKKSSKLHYEPILFGLFRMELELKILHELIETKLTRVEYFDFSFELSSNRNFYIRSSSNRISNTYLAELVKSNLG